jgi:hypothetical protein
MEHDGPNVHYGRRQGSLLLRVYRLQGRHGTLTVRGNPMPVSRAFVPNRHRARSRVERSRNPIILQYLLPDFSLNRPGELLGPNQVVKDASWQILEMNNERFTVPELLFTPSDIGEFLPSSNERDVY